MRRTVSGISILSAEFRRRIRCICARSRRRTSLWGQRMSTWRSNIPFWSDGGSLGTSISQWRASWRRDDGEQNVFPDAAKLHGGAPPAAYPHWFYDGRSGEYGTFSQAHSLLWNRLLLWRVCTVCLYDRYWSEATSCRSESCPESEGMSVPEKAVGYDDGSTRERWKQRDVRM